MDTFVKRLKELKDQKQVTQSEIAEAIGVAQPQISAYLKGVDKPSSETLMKLAKYFGVSPEYMLGVSNIVVNEPSPAYQTTYTSKYYNEVVGVLKEQIHNLLELATKHEDTQSTMIKLRQNLVKEIKIKDELIKSMGI